MASMIFCAVALQMVYNLAQGCVEVQIKGFYFSRAKTDTRVPIYYIDRHVATY
jgi:hypothetical protein